MLNFWSVSGEVANLLMKCPLDPDIPINTLCVATGWGSTGTWTVQFRDKPMAVAPSNSNSTGTAETEITTADAYDYSKNVVGQVGNKKAVRITVAAKNDAHVGLGENNEHNCKRYEVVIGGWGNGAS